MRSGWSRPAVYRYVDSRDDLLTRLVCKAHGDLGAAADSVPDDDLGRWISIAEAIRDRALPPATSCCTERPCPVSQRRRRRSGRVAASCSPLTGVLADAHAGERLAAPICPVLAGDGPLATELALLGADAGIDVPAATIVAFVAAWTQMFGVLSFEITSQTRGMVERHDLLYRATIHRIGHRIGSRGGSMET